MVRCRREAGTEADLYICFVKAKLARLMSENRLSSQWARSIGVAEISQNPVKTHVKYESVSAFRRAVGQGIVLGGW